MSENIKVRFRGRELVWLREADGAGALAYPEHINQAGEVTPLALLLSYAHVFADGTIWRNRRQIATVADLEILQK